MIPQRRIYKSYHDKINRCTRTRPVDLISCRHCAFSAVKKKNKTLPRLLSKHTDSLFAFSSFHLHGKKYRNAHSAQTFAAETRTRSKIFHYLHHLPCDNKVQNPMFVTGNKIGLSALPHSANHTPRQSHVAQPIHCHVLCRLRSFFFFFSFLFQCFWKTHRSTSKMANTRTFSKQSKRPSLIRLVYNSGKKKNHKLERNILLGKSGFTLNISIHFTQQNQHIRRRPLRA